MDGRTLKKIIIILAVIDIAILVFLMIETREADAAYVSAPEGLLIRKEPGTEAEILGVLPFASEAYGETEEGWMRLEGQDGYVCADFLTDRDPLDDFRLLGEWRVTAYAETGCACANGRYPEVDYTIACNSLPLGAVVYIEGVGFRTVEDRGPDYMGSEWCDLYLGIHEDCVQWGDQYRDVYLVE